MSSPPAWNDALEFQIGGEDILRVELWDKDNVTRDGYIAEADLAIQDILAQ